jgi:hypothetical protein
MILRSIQYRAKSGYALISESAAAQADWCRVTRSPASRFDTWMYGTRIYFYKIERYQDGSSLHIDIKVTPRADRFLILDGFG